MKKAASKLRWKSCNLAPMQAKRSSTKRNFGGLTVLAILFCGSAGVRLLGDGPEDIVENWATISAWAQTEDTTSQTPQTGSGNGLEAFITTMAEREQRVLERERLVEERENELELSSERLQANIQALQEAESELRATISLAEGAAQSDVQQLTRMFETMKPKDAANLFATMDIAFAAGFLGEMNPASAAQILAGLPPETAYGISLVLAGRNVQPN